MDEEYSNSEITDETALGKLMHDFRCRHASEMKYGVLSKKVSSLKNTDEGVDSMCKAVEEYGMELREAGIAEGMEKGMEKGITKAMISSIQALMTSLKYTAEQAMDILNVPQQDRSGYLAQLGER